MQKREHSLGEKGWPDHLSVKVPNTMLYSSILLSFVKVVLSATLFYLQHT